MEPIGAANFLTGLGFIVLVFGLFYGPWQTLVISTTRQSIFELRDAWFDATALDEQTRNDEAVRRFRTFLNSSIAILDMLTWMSLLAFILQRRSSSVATSHPARGLHGDLQKLARQTYHCTAMFVLGHALARSIVLFPAGVALLQRTRARSKAICEGHRSHRTKINRIVIHEIERATIAMGEAPLYQNVRRRRALSM